jgi:hypothetical protein
MLFVFISDLYNNLNALNFNNSGSRQQPQPQAQATSLPHQGAPCVFSQGASASADTAPAPPQISPLQMAGDLNLPLPLATQWLMNNNLMAHSSPAPTARAAPLINLNQSLTTLLPAFLSNPQLASQMGTKIAPTLLSFPSLDMTAFSQQLQPHPLSNLQFQPQFLDSIKNNVVSDPKNILF